MHTMKSLFVKESLLKTPFDLSTLVWIISLITALWVVRGGQRSIRAVTMCSWLCVGSGWLTNEVNALSTTLTTKTFDVQSQKLNNEYLIMRHTLMSGSNIIRSRITERLGSVSFWVFSILKLLAYIHTHPHVVCQRILTNLRPSHQLHLIWRKFLKLLGLWSTGVMYVQV